LNPDMYASVVPETAAYYGWPMTKGGHALFARSPGTLAIIPEFLPPLPPPPLLVPVPAPLPLPFPVPALSQQQMPMMTGGQNYGAQQKAQAAHLKMLGLREMRPRAPIPLVMMSGGQPYAARPMRQRLRTHTPVW
jgi:hypothetical protein